jgi:hypothetical protein
MKRRDWFLASIACFFATVGGYSDSSNKPSPNALIEAVRRVILNSEWLQSREGKQYIFPQDHEVIQLAKELLGIKEENLLLRIYFEWDGQGSIPVFLTLLKGEEELGYIGLIWSSQKDLLGAKTPTMISVNWVGHPNGFVVITNRGPQLIKLQIVFRSYAGRDPEGVISRENIFPLKVGETQVKLPDEKVACLRFLIFD